MCGSEVSEGHRSPEVAVGGGSGSTGGPFTTRPFEVLLSLPPLKDVARGEPVVGEVPMAVGCFLNSLEPFFFDEESTEGLAEGGKGERVREGPKKRKNKKFLSKEFLYTDVLMDCSSPLLSSRLLVGAK